MVLDVRLVGEGERFEFWRHSFAGTPGDGVRLARDAAAGIERALAVAASKEDTLAPLGEEAYALYLKGRAAYREIWPESTTRGAEAFERALVLAPDHPLLLAALASAQARLAFYSQGRTAKALALADRAVALAPHLAEPHVARATALLQDANAEDAIDALTRALELAPGQIQALSVLAELLLELGAPADATRVAEVTRTRAPAMDAPFFQLARVHALLGRWEAASATLDEIHAESSLLMTSALRCRYAMWYRDRRPIEAAMDRLRAIGAPRNLTQYRVVYVIGDLVLEGRSPRANAEHQRTKFGESPTPKRRSFILQIDAEMDAYLGDHASAIASIEASVQAGLLDNMWLERCPLFDDLRGSLRFEHARDVVRERARRALARLHRGPDAP
jgi:serine/threonine-protein kinase